MKKILQTIIILGIFALAFHFRFELNQKFQPYIQNVREFLGLASGLNPCVEPIPYVIGGFDTEFNISKDYFLSAIRDAEAIWEKPYSKELFSYAPENTEVDTLKINLVYDFRQQATTKLKTLGIDVDNTRASYDELKAKYDSKKREYENDVQNFNTKVENFNRKQAEYEKDVKYWNSRGGAPEDEYNKLQDRQSSLEAESRQIQSLQNKLSDKGDEVNALVVTLNRLITTLNLSVDKYNTTSVARGETFEEGVYVSDGLTSEIDIYEFSSRDKLVRVLAHELGHALGLDHVEDPASIMYELNQGNSMSLSSDDIDALESKCGAANI